MRRLGGALPIRCGGIPLWGAFLLQGYPILEMTKCTCFLTTNNNVLRLALTWARRGLDSAGVTTFPSSQTSHEIFKKTKANFSGESQAWSLHWDRKKALCIIDNQLNGEGASFEWPPTRRPTIQSLSGSPPAADMCQTKTFLFVAPWLDPSPCLLAHGPCTTAPWRAPVTYPMTGVPWCSHLPSRESRVGEYGPHPDFYRFHFLHPCILTLVIPMQEKRDTRRLSYEDVCP